LEQGFNCIAIQTPNSGVEKGIANAIEYKSQREKVLKGKEKTRQRLGNKFKASQAGFRPVQPRFISLSDYTSRVNEIWVKRKRNGKGSGRKQGREKKRGRPECRGIGTGLKD